MKMDGWVMGDEGWLRREGGERPRREAKGSDFCFYN
jgi:hypothetical protein